jgi:hypothetical protein
MYQQLGISEKALQRKPQQQQQQNAGNKRCTETQDTQGFQREEKSRELQAFYIEIGRIAFDAKLYMLWLDGAVEQP